MKTIVLPTDFSDNAYNAISFAMQLFKEEECVFHIIHAYTPVVYQSEYVLHSPGQIGSGDTGKIKFLEKLEALKRKIEEDFNNPNHRIITHTAFNILIDEILTTSDNQDADVVIMGTQGATGAKEIFLGSHTVHVIQKSNRPVLAIPSNFKYIKPKKILFPTDFKVNYSKAQLSSMLSIAKEYKSRIEIIYVSDGNDLTEKQLNNKQKLVNLLKGVRHLFHHRPHQGVIQGINDFQSKNTMNLLVMIKNKHTFIERLFIEPIIKKIGFHLSIPFLVLPNSIKN
ncbi:universal stress protein [Maribacter sp.]|uniref:universal stress protein n=1 Tax=Maribacter sp. TaxID=1897614 RepID=UPI0025BBB3BD|nr:universal stress protein [Maribacter sp.]